MITKKLISLSVFLFLFIIIAQKGICAGEVTELIDIPTSAVIGKGNYQITNRLFTNGGVMVRGKIGLAPRFNFGITYAGAKIISEDNPDWNPNVAMDFKYRLSDGGEGMPSISVGYDGQGYGPFYKDAPSFKKADPADRDTKSKDRYRYKSKGFFLVFSNEFKNIGGIEIHGGANYSFEAKDDKSGDMFFGLNKKIGPEIMVMVDYDLALNDDDKDYSYGSGKGYLNSGVRWYFAPELSIEFDMLNLTENGKIVGGDRISRMVKINYTSYF
ncbi:hypothetical protein HZA55_08185 [Candidatus Poribacteria bacterium]|nr:hypothetical protein [Candidatus Poribacteria bacterium]